MSKYCPRCGSLLESDGKCRFCGYTLDKEEVVAAVKKSTPALKKCPVCFADLDSDGKCKFCGYKADVKDLDDDDDEYEDEEEEFDAEYEDEEEEYESDFDSDSIFNDFDWEDAWQEARDSFDKLGIILTNSKKLNNEGYLDAIYEFIDIRDAEGVAYFILDLANQCISDGNFDECEDVVELLEEIYEVATPDYLFILGDETVVPSEVWDNECGDGDPTVRSDLPYITFDCDSPWDGKIYDFKNVTSVGRLPCNETTLDGVNNYVQTVSDHVEKQNIKSFVYSAKVWEQTTNVTFAHLNASKYLSPEYTIKQKYVEQFGMKLFDVKTEEFDFLNFNLHGSDQTNVWYGQTGNVYPDAFDAKCLPQKDGYAMLTEACYGAKSKIGKAGQSILVTSLFNGCLAFVGSSRIAYGCGNGQMSCADVVSYVYTKDIQNGSTFGTAFLKALDKMCTSNMDEAEIKTIAEFNLYGDPSLRLCPSATNAKAYGMVKRSKTVTDEKYSVKLMSCTIGEAGGMALYGYSAKAAADLQKIVKKLNETSNAYVSSNYASYKNVQPDIYKVVGKSGFRAIYIKEVSKNVKSVLNVHMDDNGEVEKTYFSK